MGLPFRQAAKIGAYVVKKQLSGKKYPLVLMLEPLFRCNLACAGCGKIDYPDEILNQRMSVQACMDAIDECGAPAVSIAGGEPLLHRDMAQIVQGYLDRDKFVILCTNALLLAKKINQYTPHPNFTWSIHLDGDKAMHDKSPSRWTAPMTAPSQPSSWPSQRASAPRSTALCSTAPMVSAPPSSSTR